MSNLCQILGCKEINLWQKMVRDMELANQPEEMTADLAWQAYRQQDYALAGTVLCQLMGQTDSIELQNEYRYHYTYVLLAQDQRQQAYAILQELFEGTGNPLYWHQMSFVAREASSVAMARAELLMRKAELSLTDHVNLADTAYEQGLLALLQSDLQAANEHAHESLQHALAAENVLSIAMAHRLLGDVMTAIQQREEAKKHYQAAFLAVAKIKTLHAMAQNEARTG
jgi:tetratricopeptide (TPR) repeat protein